VPENKYSKTWAIESSNLEGEGVKAAMFRLLIEVAEVQGHCPVYQVGDRFHIQEGYKLIAEQALCMHALGSLYPYYIPLSRGHAPADLGLAGPDEAAYVQCLDPQRYTGGGTVTFRISPLPLSGNRHLER
jgi:uncharacterized repeat protein (TIGR04076 family)